MRGRNLASHKRILYLIPTADLYGCSRVLLELLEHLPRDQYEPVVILPEPGPIQYELSLRKIDSHILPITVIRRNSIKGIALLNLIIKVVPNMLRMVHFIRKNHIDLVHTNSIVILTGAFAAYLVGIPHIWHIHEIMGEEFAFLWRYFQPLILKLSARVICISNITACQFPASLKVRVIPNGLNLDKFEVESQQQNQGECLIQKSDDLVTIGVVGRINPRKGQGFLLDCYAALIQQETDTKSELFIIGDIFPGYENYLVVLQKKVIELGLEHHVKFTGFVKNVAPLYRQLDIIVVPSLLPEGFGLVILEAMATRRPVIATALGGPLEIIENHESGLLVPYDRPGPMVDAMDYLITHPDERIRLGEGGYQRVRRSFRIEKTIGLILQSYLEVIG